MKITTAQLRGIIREEIIKAQSGKSLNEDGIRAAGGRIIASFEADGKLKKSVSVDRRKIPHKVINDEGLKELVKQIDDLGKEISAVANQIKGLRDVEDINQIMNWKFGISSDFWKWSSKGDIFPKNDEDFEHDDDWYKEKDRTKLLKGPVLKPKKK